MMSYQTEFPITDLLDRKKKDLSNIIPQYSWRFIVFAKSTTSFTFVFMNLLTWYRVNSSLNTFFSFFILSSLITLMLIEIDMFIMCGLLTSQVCYDVPASSWENCNSGKAIWVEQPGVYQQDLPHVRDMLITDCGCTNQLILIAWIIVVEYLVDDKKWQPRPWTETDWNHARPKAAGPCGLLGSRSGFLDTTVCARPSGTLRCLTRQKLNTTCRKVPFCQKLLWNLLIAGLSGKEILVHNRFVGNTRTKVT